MPHNDPIVNEVRESRELILKKFNGDLENYFQFIRQEENKNKQKLANISSIVIPPKKTAR
ncbi:MAG: hypothetical protein VR69_00745 [Peptococcaceae bacterium BRH_c4b]|nr:MAG: hypothetical protein VR69_00695 [Peptococcaceae bacterium BRH_c4b]KJS18391.1 MAG: hypothetical protein VR69_00745 [Peptococcaceae bacterium BRH_c4b]